MHRNCIVVFGEYPVSNSTHSDKYALNIGTLGEHESAKITAIQAVTQQNGEHLLYANSDYRKGSTSYSAGYL